MSLTPKILSFAVCVALAGTAAAATNNAGAIGQIKAHGADFKTASGDAFVVTSTITDPSGDQHFRVDRKYNGLTVIGGDAVVHLNGKGQFKGSSLTLSTNARPSLHAAISADQAMIEAGAKFGTGFTGVPTSTPVIYARGARPQLAYEVVFSGMKADQTPTDMHYIVSADRTKRILESWDTVEKAASAGTFRTIYSGNISGAGSAATTNSITGGFELRDPTRGNGYTVSGAKGQTSGKIYTDADNTWGNNTNSDVASAAADAQYGVGVTWDYYKNVHGRTGIDGAGTGAHNLVHYGRNYVNAYWSDSCYCMTYGDGDGVTYGPLVNLDVAGHEMSHGVTSRTSKLVYSGESGGLNEANSDIMGTMVEFYANNANDPGDYLIGEKIYLSNPGNLKALRWMFKPSRDTRSPDCYVSTIGSLDVHYSSGVANHFYYLLAEGAVNPAGFSYTPAQLVCNGNTAAGGIGRAKAEKIWFRGMTVYFTSSTNYAGARAATLQAAADLYGAGSAEQNAVAASWSAVGVN